MVRRDGVNFEEQFRWLRWRGEEETEDKLD